MIILFRLFRKRSACLFSSIFVFLCEGPGKWVTALHTHTHQPSGKVETNWGSSFSGISCVLHSLHKYVLRLSTTLNDLFGVAVVTDGFMACQRTLGQSANFLTRSSLIQTGHHLSRPLCLFSICSSITHISLFPFICPGSLSRRRGTSK